MMERIKCIMKVFPTDLDKTGRKIKDSNALLLLCTILGVSAEKKHTIGLAISKDGINWERYSDTPVFNINSDGNAWDAGGVSSPHLVYIPERKVWRMYYVGYPMTSDGSDHASWNGIGVAESTDEKGLEFFRIKV